VVSSHSVILSHRDNLTQLISLFSTSTQPPLTQPNPSHSTTTQTLSGVTSAAFSKDGTDYTSEDGSDGNYAAINALKTTLAALMGLAASNVEILSVTTVWNPTGTPTGAPTRFQMVASQRLLSKLELDQEVQQAQEAQQRNAFTVGADVGLGTSPAVRDFDNSDRENQSQRARRLDSPNSCTITYKVTFFAQDIGYSDTVAAYVAVTNALQKSLVNGDFTAALSAVASMYGVDSLAGIELTVECQTNDPNSCSLIGAPTFIYLTPAPTPTPSVKPTGAFSSEALNQQGWSPLRLSLIVGLGGVGLLTLAFSLWYFRHNLPGKGYKRRDHAFKENARRANKPSLGLGPGADRIMVPNIITLDDLMGEMGSSHRKGGGSDYGDAMSDLSERSLGNSSLHSSLHATGGFMPTGSGRKPRLNPAAAAPPSGGPRSGRPPATPTMQRERDGRDGRAARDFDFSAQGQLTIRR